MSSFFPVAGSLLLCATGVAYGQSVVSGTVQDDGGKPLAYANVLLVNATDSALVKGVVTSETGQFRVENVRNGTYRVAASGVGYQKRYSSPFTLDGTASRHAVPTLHIAPQAKQLGEVTVAAQKPLFEQQMDRLVVNVQNSITAAGSTALDVLERSPGVTVDRQNNTLALSGKNGVLVQINGKLNRLPMDALVQMLAGMNASNIEKIELITNPSARYDAEGDAGIINIVLKKNTSFGTNGNLSLTAGYGYYPKPAGSINLNHRREKLNVFGEYSALYNKMWQRFYNNRAIVYQGQTTTTDVDSRRIGQRWVNNARLGFDYTPGKNTTIGAVISGFDNRWRMVANNHSAINQPDLWTAIDIVNHERNTWRHWMGSVNLRHTFASKHELSIDADYLWYHNSNPHTYTNDYRSIRQTGKVDVPLEMTTDRTLITIAKLTPIRMGVLKADYSIPFGKGSKLEFGAKSTISRLNNDVRVDRNEQLVWRTDPDLTQTYSLIDDIHAGYVNLQHTLSPNVSFQAGLRYEHTHTELSTPTQARLVYRYYGNLFPSVFLTRTLSKSSSLQASYSRRIQRPSFNAIAPFVVFLDPNTYMSGNPALLPALTDAVQTTYRFKDSYLLTLRYSYDKNAIFFGQPRVDAATNRTYNAPTNIRDVNSMALTFAFPLKLTPGWQAQTNLMGVYQRSATNYEGRALQLTQAFANVQLTQTLKLGRDLTGELTTFYRSPFLLGLNRVAAIASVDAGVQKKLARNRGNLRLGVQDLFWTYQFRGTINQPQINLVQENGFVFEPRVVRLTYTRNVGNQNVKAGGRRATGSDEERRRVSTE